jgi:electron transfer flavoprotein alpha subunit
MGVARRLADKSGRQLHAIVVGAEAEPLASEVVRVADGVTIADQAELAEYQPEICLTAVTHVCSKLSPIAVLLADGTYSQEIAPRLAYRLGGSAVGDAVDVELLGETVRAKRQVYGGKAQAIIELKCKPAVVWLRARSFQPAALRGTAGEINRVDLSFEVDARTRIVERRREDSGQLRLEDARIIVAGGRGIGGHEPFVKNLQPLAELLGAQMAATRAACDAGWAPATWQVGLSGWYQWREPTYGRCF